MNVRILVICMIIGISFVGQVQGAYTDYGKTSYLGADNLPTLTDALDLSTAISTMNRDVTDFGVSAPFMSGDDWAKKADQLSKRNEEIKKGSSNIGNKEDAFQEYWKNMDLINKANRNAISKYAEDNANGKNDIKISQRHFNIAENFHRYSERGRDEQDPEWKSTWLSALEAATEADITNVKAWDERITLLEELGRKDEAAQVRDEMNSRVGSAAIDLFLPMSPLTAIAGIVLACLALVSGFWRKRGNPPFSH